MLVRSFDNCLACAIESFTPSINIYSIVKTIHAYFILYCFPTSFSISEKVITAAFAAIYPSCDENDVPVAESF